MLHNKKFRSQFKAIILCALYPSLKNCDSQQAINDTVNSRCLIIFTDKMRLLRITIWYMYTLLIIYIYFCKCYLNRNVELQIWFATSDVWRSSGRSSIQSPQIKKHRKKANFEAALEARYLKLESFVPYVKHSSHRHNICISIFETIALLWPQSGNLETIRNFQIALKKSN